MKIERIVFKKLRRKLTDEESIRFQEWIDTSDKNRKIFDRLKSLKGQGEILDHLMEMDIDTAWKKLHLKVSEQKQPRNNKHRINSWLSYAASLIVLVGVGYFFLTSTDNTTIQPPVTLEENSVTLEMSDGNIMVISAEGSENIVDGDGQNVGVQQGTKITYKNETEPLENVVEELVYNTLVTPNGAETFELILSDDTKVIVNAGSSLKFPRKFIQGKDRIVFLEGEAYFEVSEDKKHAFIVNTDEMDVRVLGTKFCINSYEGNTNSHVVLLEGSVSAYQEGSTFDSDQSKLLKPNDLASIEKGGENINIRQVDTSIYTAWMSGKLVFVKVPFQDMLKGIERKFNIKIINNYTELNKQLFTANFNEESLDQIMKTIQKYEYFEYEIIQNQFNENQLIINQTLN